MNKIALSGIICRLSVFIIRLYPLFFFGLKGSFPHLMLTMLHVFIKKQLWQTFPPFLLSQVEQGNLGVLL